MDDIEFQSIVVSEVQNALGYYDTEYARDRIRLHDYYMGEPLGNEQEGRSQVISTEVADTIEMMMPSLMRIFSSTDRTVEFVPRGPEDVEAAAQATDYCNFIFNNDNDGFLTLHNWFKDGLLQKLGVVKTWWEEEAHVDEELYEGLSDIELSAILADPDVEIVERDEIPFGPEPAEGEEDLRPLVYDVRVRRVETSGKVIVENVPPEEFLFSKRTKNLKDAPFVAHRTVASVSDLIARGYDEDDVVKHAGYNELEELEERQSRFDDLESNAEFDRADPAMQNVLVTEVYIKSDYDDDGIAELRRVVCLGDGYEIVENELFDHIPFATLSPIMMPHRLVGRSIAELVEDLQVIKSTLMRQYLDNLYAANNSRVVAVEGQVNLDDLLTNRPGGVVRARAPGMVQPLAPAPIGQQTFPMLEYLDQVREQRTGLSRASMGLDADALQSTTATAVAATVSAAQGKIEMIARVFAETGVKMLFKNILHLVTKHQNQPRIIRLRNQFVPMDPRAWTNGFDMSVNVGLGTGDTNEKVAVLAQIAAKQEQILMQLGPQNPLVTIEQYRNTLAKIAEHSGFKDAGQFFLDPAMQPPMETPQQPQADPEMMKMEAEIALKREKMMAELELKREEMLAEFELKRQELAMEAQLKGVELAAKNTMVQPNIRSVV